MDLPAAAGKPSVSFLTKGLQDVSVHVARPSDAGRQNAGSPGIGLPSAGLPVIGLPKAGSSVITLYTFDVPADCPQAVNPFSAAM